MDASELDIAISELEIRVERLRSLYEQYFLGIERLEPTVVRKDVDRRIWALKREKIRNTAKRFKLQTIIQRYNTFQQYWQRICREIERGTYRRHVLRAERATTTVSDVVAEKARLKEAAQEASHAAESTANELADMLARDVDAEQEFARALAAAEAPIERVAAPVARPHPTPEANAAPPKPMPTAATQRRARLETLDLELDSFEPTPARGGNLLASLGRKDVKDVKAGDNGVGRTPPPLRPKAPPPRSPGNTLLGEKPNPRPKPPPRTGAAAAAVPPKEAPAKPINKPAPVKPTAKPVVTAKPPVPARRAASAVGPARAGLTDTRIAELHQQLLAAKQSTKEGGNVSVTGLAKSLRAAETKLKQQHKDRRIDFDVVIKNGKAVVKPIVR